MCLARFSRRRCSVYCFVNFLQEFPLTCGIIQFLGKILWKISATTVKDIILHDDWLLLFILLHCFGSTFKFIQLLKQKITFHCFLFTFERLNQYIFFIRQVSCYKLYSLTIRNTQSIYLFVSLFFIITFPGIPKGIRII